MRQERERERELSMVIIISMVVHIDEEKEMTQIVAKDGDAQMVYCRKDLPNPPRIIYHPFHFSRTYSNHKHLRNQSVYSNRALSYQMPVFFPVSTTWSVDRPHVQHNKKIEKLHDRYDQ